MGTQRKTAQEKYQQGIIRDSSPRLRWQWNFCSRVSQARMDMNGLVKAYGHPVLRPTKHPEIMKETRRKERIVKAMWGGRINGGLAREVGGLDKGWSEELHARFRKKDKQRPHRAPSPARRSRPETASCLSQAAAPLEPPMASAGDTGWGPWLCLS